MGIATMIISLILMLVVGAQSCAVGLGVAALETKAAEQGWPIGLFMAFLFLIGGAFALAFPFVSLLAYFFAGIIGLAGGANTSFGDFDCLGRRVFDPDRPQLLRLEGDAQGEARRSCQGSFVG